MVLVDTCGWIEWLTDGKLANDYAPWFQEPENLLVPTIVQFDLYKWTKRERDEALALRTVALTEQATVVPLDTSLALLAGDFALEHCLALADAVVYATARQHEALLVTSDRHFEGLAGVEYFRK
ncbi:MAG: type II toxin-antitoxin system VapC family toxin [Gammaproteobacteria bacterium]|nr:MAG: type II toxin-antitoxin system VapC family toxin [Gammaproteobacteria bacterium]